MKELITGLAITTVLGVLLVGVYLFPYMLKMVGPKVKHIVDPTKDEKYSGLFLLITGLISFIICAVFVVATLGLLYLSVEYLLLPIINSQ